MYETMRRIAVKFFSIIIIVRSSCVQLFTIFSEFEFCRFRLDFMRFVVLVVSLLLWNLIRISLIRLVLL